MSFSLCTKPAEICPRSAAGRSLLKRALKESHPSNFRAVWSARCERDIDSGAWGRITLERREYNPDSPSELRRVSDPVELVNTYQPQYHSPLVVKTEIDCDGHEVIKRPARWWILRDTWFSALCHALLHDREGMPGILVRCSTGSSKTNSYGLTFYDIELWLSDGSVLKIGETTICDSSGTIVQGAVRV